VKDVSNHVWPGRGNAKNSGESKLEIRDPGFAFLKFAFAMWHEHVSKNAGALRPVSMEYKLELIPVPVEDIDRAKSFYTEILGFNADLDVSAGESFRVVQLTPNGSACSIAIGTIVSTPPGSVQGLHLVVADILGARAELAARGLEIDEVTAMGSPGKPMVYYAGFQDPDGNTWTLQQIGDQ
jgi:catechol 2,3-dioxygenase-like lactoylglutathione lyase family enzyme